MREAAVKARISNPYLSQLERDRREDNPSLKTLRQLASAYDVTEAEMFNAAGCQIEDVSLEMREIIARLQTEINALNEIRTQIASRLSDEGRAVPPAQF
jgi:transcriptional regulator with XRE-family HTH domain